MKLPVWQRLKADVESRLAKGLADGLIDSDQFDVLLEHLIWTEVNDVVNIGYSRRPRIGR